MTADGNNSTALGKNAGTGRDDGSGAFFPGHGAFVFGDASGSTVVRPSADNQFVVRASGGVTFYTSPDLSSGVSLSAGGGSWDVLSDVRMKTNFRDLDGETVLSKLARIPIREWNYITQAATIRHVGPTAQDFHAAFGLGEDNTHINTLDPDGISLLAIQALDARTAAMKADVAKLQEQNAALKAEIELLKKILAALTERR